MPLSYSSYIESTSPGASRSTSTTTTMASPGPEHVLFRQWVLEQDVQINGVTPTKFEGRGIGIVAEREIKAGEEIVNVPISALLSTDSIVPEVRDAALEAGISVHGLLAMYLAVTAMQPEDPYACWRRVWPSRADLSSLPIMWPYSLRGLKKEEGSDVGAGPGTTTWSPLPPSINGEWSKDVIGDLRLAGLATTSSRLERMRRKVDKDWTRAKALCEGQIRYEDYLYHWLIVNTRSFFFDGAQDQQEQQQQQNEAESSTEDGTEPSNSGTNNNEDKMALCPFIDYFNHAAQGCKVAFDDQAYTVVADRTYRKGEELYVSYGDHDNDLLLTDYGFVLSDNPSADSVTLDDVVLFASHSGVYRWRNLLAEHGYLREYRLHASDGTPCYRTQIAAAVKLLPEPDWTAIVRGERLFTDEEKVAVESHIKTHWIAAWQRETERALRAWSAPHMLDDKNAAPSIREVAVGRWKQIDAILKKAAGAGI